MTKTFIKVLVPESLTKQIEKLGSGYDEFTDMLSGQDSVEEYNETIDGMGNSEPDSISERIMATRYHNIAYEILDILKERKLISEELINEMENSVEGLPFDDEYEEK